MVGSLGAFLGKYNIYIFGYFAYIYPIILITLIYFSFKNIKDFTARLVELISGLSLLFFTILIAQATIFSTNKGLIGQTIVISLKDMIGSAGMWVFIIMIFVLSLVLIFEEKIATIIKKSFITPKKHLEIIVNSKKENDEITNCINQPKENETLEENEQKINLSLDEKDNKIIKENSNFKEVEQINEKEKSLNLEPINLKTTILEPEISSENKNITKKPKILNKVEHLKEVAENKKLLDQLDKGESVKVVDFKLPNLDFLNDPPKTSKNVDEEEIDQKIYDLLDKLRRFKIDGDVVRTYSGPVVTTFEFRPAANVKVSKILNLEDDLAMALKAKTIRIQAPIPGKDVVGIEIPNKNIETIYLKEILQSEIFKKASSPLTIALGKDIVGQPFITDLKKLPHLLIAGTTGSGKSVGINSMLLSLLYKNSPKTLRLIMIDPKMLEFSIYNDIPHLLTPVITDSKKALIALSNLVSEMERRYKIMAQTSTKNIENYNQKAIKNNFETFPYIVVIIDELADLMMTSGKDVEFYIARLAQMARASGIHLIVATQRPSVNVVTGLIKANLPSRISFRVGQKIDSKVILDQMGADSLLGRGDMLFTPPSNTGLIRLHAPFATEEEILKVVEFLKSQGPAIYDDRFLEETSSEENKQNIDDIELDELYEEAKEIILTDEKTSISYLQRRLKIGYNRAATIIEQLEAMGVLSEVNAKGQRDIIR
ncbi:DNA translocase FtsK 4TM domain-containing protein [Campylobacter ureolyticus]|uniref:DNA translocase FtsK 4TM domain-containing protein n=1 Tax=Campylobacter ureolyticus TaxID=827 RepID=UPI0022B3E804|nr:DNA translocase FtsK 4TM domain-containing protein [Campylobacter ureolyticus]MCZ6105425.1 DNA translocase FtsK 4TM domain-containing protein [Campylobacter ureolyticus]MCZ6158337.1 DNA translocase FtsK 4TM domain-containing protein [Campylobacter ureolyticus]